MTTENTPSSEASPATPPRELKEVACVVCGMKSTREDWQDNPSPACDKHTKDEVAAEGEAKEGFLEHIVHEVEGKVEEVLHPSKKGPSGVKE